MTVADLKSMKKEVLTPAIVAQVTGSSPQHIRTAARQAPHLLGYPVIVEGNRVKIPRLAFIQFMEGVSA